MAKYEVENKYDLEFIDVTNDIDHSYPLDPFHKMDLKNFWRWNYLETVHFNWDKYIQKEYHIKHFAPQVTYSKLINILLVKDKINNANFELARIPHPDVVGPLHFMIKKDGKPAYISFGYMRGPGVYEQYFNFFIPVPHDDKQQLWTYSRDHDAGLGNFLESIGKPIKLLFASIPPKSTMMYFIRRRKCTKIIQENPSPATIAHQLVIEFNFDGWPEKK